MCQCQCRRRWCQPTAVERTGVGGALIESGSGAATCVGVGGGGAGVSRRQLRELESAEQLSTVDRMPPRVSVSGEEAAVSADSSGESLSRRSTSTQLSSPMAVSTVDRLLPRRVSVSVVETSAVSADGSVESWRRRSTCRQWIGCRHVCWCRLRCPSCQPTAVERS